MGGEMNSEEGLRALESLHDRLCVLERANSHRLGVKYNNYNNTLGGIFALALPTINMADGKLSQAEQNVLAKKIATALKDNADLISDPNQFQRDIYEMIQQRTQTYIRGVLDPHYYAVSHQMYTVFRVAFQQAFQTALTPPPWAPQ